MSWSKVDGTLGAGASIGTKTPGGPGLFPQKRKKPFRPAPGIILPAGEYSTAKGSLAPVLPAKIPSNPMNDHIVHDHSNDGIDRRGFLKCMAWAGTGVLWSLNAGVLTSRALGQTIDAAAAPLLPGTLNFVQ